VSGTIDGSRRAAETSKARHGADWFKRIGQLGGQISRGGGFAKNPELARTAGSKGGKATRKTRVMYPERWKKVNDISAEDRFRP
jgi:general stress protein YciG